MIRPDQDIISRLCNFDEEEEDEITDVSDNDDHDDVPDDKVNLSLLELKHIMSSLVLEHIEGDGRLEFVDQVTGGRRCSVCHQNIFSMILQTGSRCEICSFIACSHCCCQMTMPMLDQSFQIPVSLLTPSSVGTICRKQINNFSSLSVMNLMSQYQERTSISSNSLSTSSSSSFQWFADKVRGWG